MYEITTADPELDPFNISRRPLKIKNCNCPPIFRPINTRLELPNLIFDSLKEYLESVYDIKVQPQNDQSIESNFENEDVIFSDHFLRCFTPFSNPIPFEKPPPFFDPRIDNPNPPFWMCDLPSTTMKREPKIYFNDAYNPLLTKRLPKCDFCGEQVTYPFFASLNNNLCSGCLKSGKIPPLTTTLEFFTVEDPEKLTGAWTLEETNKLLTTIENIGDDWRAVSNIVKTHSPAECLIHFMRLPMYDPYYISDPLEVPEGKIPNEPNILPFMVAPDPIAAYVEFLHVLNKKLGNKIAEISQRQIEQILSSKSGVMLFNHIPSIIKNLLEKTGEEAFNLAKDGFSDMISSMQQIIRLMEKEINEQFSLFNSGLKESQNLASQHYIHQSD